MSAKRVGGRPPTYSLDQLRKAVEIAEARNEAPTPGKILAILVDEFAISPTINAKSLEINLAQLLKERERERVQSLVDALPAEVTEGLAVIASTVLASTKEVVAPIYESLRRHARRDLDAKEVDNAALRTALASRDAELEEAHQLIGDLEREKAEVEEQRDRLGAENEALRRQVLDDERKRLFLDEMKALIASAADTRKPGPAE